MKGKTAEEVLEDYLKKMAKDWDEVESRLNDYKCPKGLLYDDNNEDPIELPTNFTSKRPDNPCFVERL